jgi:two-component system sensor histidine kinase YesM
MRRPVHLFNKFVLAFIAVGLAPVIVLAFLSAALFRNESRIVLEDSYRQAAMYGARNVENLIGQYNSTSQMLYSYEGSSAGFANVLKMPEANQADNYRRYNAIISFLHIVQASDPYIESIIFVESANAVYTISRTGRSLGNKNAFLEIVSKYATADPAALILIPSHDDSYFRGAERQVFTIGRNYIDPGRSLGDYHILGTLYIEVDSDAFTPLFKPLDAYTGSAISIYGKNNELVYANPFYNEKKGEIPSNYLTITMPIEGAGWNLRISADTASALTRLARILRIISLAAVIILGALLILSFVYSRTLSSFLGEVRRKEAELASLRSQIKPHFLYNSLEIIRMNAVTHDDETTADLAYLLAQQMRSQLRSAQGKLGVVSLKDELELLQGYLTFIELRYGHEISGIIESDPGLDNAQIPSLVLQPIAENAVVHGLEPRGAGWIKIKAEKNGKNLVITIRDNGIGMDQAALGRQRKMLENEAALDDFASLEKNEAKDSIGLKNVNDRLRYRYGAGYGVKIESEEQNGTLITLTLPLIMMEKNHV